MSWNAEILLLHDEDGVSFTAEAAEKFVGQEVEVTVNGKHSGLAKIIAARYAEGTGVYATVEFGDDTPLGAIVPEDN